MEKLLYPFTNLSHEQIPNIANKIEIKEEQNELTFYVKDKKIEEDKLYIGMLSYIKLIELLLKENKDINKTIIEIKDDVVNRIVDLKDAGEKVLLEKLQLENDKITLLLLKNIIEAYEIEYDVVKTDDPKKYKPTKDKTSDTMNMKKELILELINTAK